MDDRLENVVDVAWTARMDGLVFEPASGPLPWHEKQALGGWKRRSSTPSETT